MGDLTIRIHQVDMYGETSATQLLNYLLEYIKRQYKGQVSHTLPIRSISFRPPSTYAKQLTLAGSVKPRNVYGIKKTQSCSISTFTGLQHKQGVHASSIISPHPHPNRQIHQATEGVMDKDIWGTAVSAEISPSLVLVKYLVRTRNPLAKNQR